MYAIRSYYELSAMRPAMASAAAEGSAPSLSPKRLELLKELVPTARRVAFFSDPDDVPTALQLMRDAASRLGISLTAFAYKGRA